MSLGAGIADEYPRLTIGCLAQGSTIVRGHAHRLVALFGELTGIDTPNSLLISQELGAKLPVLLAHPGFVPFIVADKALQVTDPLRPFQLQGDGFHVLALSVT